MRILRLLPPIALALVGFPTVAAQPCMTQLDPLCDAADENNFDRLFGDYADVGLLATGLFLALLLITVLVALVRWPSVRPRVRSEARDSVKEIAPGQTVQLIVDVENRRKRTSVDLGLELPDVPGGWNALGFGAVAYPSGFTAPQVLPPDGALHLSSRTRGHASGAVAIALSAPAEAQAEEAHDVTLRLVPVTAGVPRRRSSRKHRFTLVVSRARPIIQIQGVTHVPPHVAPGQPVTSKATLSNEGVEAASNVAVHFLLNDEKIDEKVIASLAPKEQAAVEFHWTPVAGENRIRINIV